MPKLFEKSGPGGPGRPRGRRDTINRLLDEVASGGAEAILKKQMELARDGDPRAADMVLKRVWALPRGRPVDVELPAAIEQPADLVRAHAAVTAALAAGTITPEEAATLAIALDAQRRAIEVMQLGERLRVVEARLDEQKAAREAA